MHFPTLLSTTALALTANAFLIPAEITDDVQAAKAKAAEFVPQVLDRHNTQSLKLDCTSCPFALNTERHGAHEWANDVESDLVMHFTAKGDHLTLNGNPFYPVTVQDMPGLLYAPQVKKASSASSSEGYEKDLKLSYTLEFQDQKAEDGKTVVNIIMTILGIDGQMVRIDNIGIRAIKHADGTLSLFKIDTIAPSPTDPDAKCTTMFCRMMAKLSTAVSTARAKSAAAAHSTKHAAKKMKGFCMRCFHRLTGHPAPAHPHVPATQGEDGKTTRLPTHNHVIPGRFRAPHAHPHGLLHKTLRFARHLFTFVLLPVIVGVIVGMTASAIGMLVGQAVVFLWMRYRRNGRQGSYEAVQNYDKEDALPAYEDQEGLPAYTEERVMVAEEKEVENKA